MNSTSKQNYFTLPIAEWLGEPVNQAGLCPFIKLFYILLMSSTSSNNTNQHKAKSLGGFAQGREGGDHLELEYAISRGFMKRITSDLFSKQLQIIAASNELLDQFQSSKLLEATTDHTLSRSQISFHLVPEEQSRNIANCRRLISRKSPKALPGDLLLQRCLREVEQNCSARTLAAIKSMADDMKKMKNTIIQLESSDKLNNSRKAQTQRLEEDNMVLKGRIKELKEYNEQLQNEKRQLSESLNTRIQQESKQLLWKFDNIKIFIGDKEKMLSDRTKKVTEISESIQRAVGSLQEDGGSCQKCCSFLKRIKESLMKYRGYLQQQEGELDAMYDQYKRVFSPA